MNRLSLIHTSLVTFAVALVGLTGCSGSASTDGTGSGGSGGSATPPDLEGVVLQGGVSASMAGQLLAARTNPKLQPTPGFTAPPPVSEYLSTAPIPKFEWGWKHGSTAGVTEISYIQFGAPGMPQILRVVTDEDSFEPTAAEWKQVSIGTWITVDIFSGSFSKETMQGDAAEGDPIQFCSMPAPAK